MTSQSIETAASDGAYMRQALVAAQEAFARGEAPVGAIIVQEGQIIATGFNRREELQSPVAHAEILAIEAAARYLQSWRLTGCDLYVTLEPCIMCVGAILQARMQRVVFGCLDGKAGAVQSLYELCNDARLNHRVMVSGGVFAQESADLLGRFFSELRQKKRSHEIRRGGRAAEGA